MGIYRDYSCAEIALAQIKEHFPESRVILRSDGDPSSQNRELAERHDVEYHEEEWLSPVENGAALLIRTFVLFLDRVSDGWCLQEILQFRTRSNL